MAVAPEIECVRELGLIKERQQLAKSRKATASRIIAAWSVASPITSVRWKYLVCVEVIVKRHTDLLEVVDALPATGGLASLLYRRQQERDQHPDDRNDHQELN